MPAKSGHGDCRACGGRCCRYIVCEIPKPKGRVARDEIRWFLAHKDVTVYIEDGQWNLQVYNRCEHLTQDDRCKIYEDRFNVCRGYDTSECEASEGELDVTVFTTTADFDRYLAAKQEKKKRKRAKKRERKAAGAKGRKK